MWQKGSKSFVASDDFANRNTFNKNNYNIIKLLYFIYFIRIKKLRKYQTLIF